MELLRRIKGFVMNDNEAKAKQQDLGSVGDIDEFYGSDDALALDMKMLFRPGDLTGEVAGVQT